MVLLTRARGRLTATAAALAVVLCISAAAQSIEPGAQAIKAAFLYNFTKFIDWPDSAFPDATSPFVVCALADAAFERELRTILEAEHVRGRPVEIRSAGQAADLRSCHMAYFSQAETDRAAKRLVTVSQAPVLTVGEGRRFLERGGLIAFYLEHDRVRFIVRKTAADAAGLQISSKLLRVAREVE